MAGGLLKYRHLGRNSSHRKALLRNLVSSLIEHESITTTWHKAKEAQRLAEKLITLGKRNSAASQLGATKILMTNPNVDLHGKLFGPLRDRYATRPGGYTRVLRIEPEKEDQAASAILELVDGPRDMRMALTAKSIARARARAAEDGRAFALNDMTAHNVLKVTRFRGEDGERALDEMVQKFEALAAAGDQGVEEVKKKRVYPAQERSR